MKPHRQLISQGNVQLTDHRNHRSKESIVTAVASVTAASNLEVFWQMALKRYLQCMDVDAFYEEEYWQRKHNKSLDVPAYEALLSEMTQNVPLPNELTVQPEQAMVMINDWDQKQVVAKMDGTYYAFFWDVNW